MDRGGEIQLAHKPVDAAALEQAKDQQMRERSQAIREIYMREKFGHPLRSELARAWTPMRATSRAVPRVRKAGAAPRVRKAGAVPGVQSMPRQLTPGTNAAAAAVVLLASAAAASDWARHSHENAQWRRAQLTAASLERFRRAELNHHCLRRAPQGQPTLTASRVKRPRRHSRDALPSCFRKTCTGRRRTVHFGEPIATALFFKQEEPAAAIGESACADSGASTNLNRLSTAMAVGLPHAGPSTTKIMGFDGRTKGTQAKTVMPYALPPEHLRGEIMNDCDLRDNLASVSRMTDAGLVCIFHPGEEGFTAYRKEDVNITYNAPPTIEGYREVGPRGPNLWRVPYRQPRAKPAGGHGYAFAARTLARQSLEQGLQTVERANNVYDLPSIEQAIHWIHAALGYPAASTWLKASRAGNLRGFPFDDVKYIRKYYPETDETPAGHLSRERQGKRSTKPRPIPFDSIDTSKLQGKKKRDVYIKIVEAKGTIYSDQTGRFPVQSQSRNKYIMLMVEVDSNAVLVEPLTSRKDAELTRAYLHLLQRLKRAGVVPTRHVLDNEVSAVMKELIRDTCKLELVPPYCHRRNVAEVQIKNFKSHFISILAGADPSFPLSLWDKLLPQAELTFNLLRQSNMAPKVSAHAHLFGPFDFNRMPLAPLGCAVDVHDTPETRRTWGTKTRPGWYIGHSPDHYRCCRSIDRLTKRERVSHTLVMKHKRITNPTIITRTKWCEPSKSCSRPSKG